MPSHHVFVGIAWKGLGGEDFGPEWTRSPVARLRYTKCRSEWTLYWRDRNQRFHRFDGAPPTPDIDTLITAIDEDATGIFWG